jgi:hypothetical protein
LRNWKTASDLANSEVVYEAGEIDYSSMG